MAGVSAPRFVEAKIAQRPVVLFSKSYCPESRKVRKLLKEEYSLNPKSFEIVNIEKRQDVNQIEDYFMIMCLSERREIPQLYIDGNYVGNEDKVMRSHDNGSLATILAAAGLLDNPSSWGKTTSPVKTCSTTKPVTPACDTKNSNSSEPTKSSDTSEPTKPVDSSESEMLVVSSKTIETGNPGASEEILTSKPAATNQPTAQISPPETSNTVASALSDDPTKPSEPTEVSETADPVSSLNRPEVAGPQDSDQSGETDQPSKPDESIENTNPTTQAETSQ